MRTQSRLPHRIAAVAGLGAIAAMGMITAGCAKEEEKAPETSTTTTTTTTTSPAAAPVAHREGAADRSERAEPIHPARCCAAASQVQPGEHGRHVTNGS